MAGCQRLDRCILAGPPAAQRVLAGGSSSACMRCEELILGITYMHACQLHMDSGIKQFVYLQCMKHTQLQ
jgi:hypothetical protein